MNMLISMFFLLLLASTLSADNSYIKMKTVLKDGIYHAKFLIKHKIVDKNEALKRSEKVQYIPHIVADINKEVIYDVWTSPLISTNPVFKFKFQYAGESNLINLNVYNNFNKLEKRTFKLNDSNLTAIKASSELRVHDIQKFPNKVWKTSTLDESIRELYGMQTKFQKGIEVKVPYLIVNNNSTPVEIKSTLDLESIAVFAESYFEESLRAIFVIPKNGIIDYLLSIKMLGLNCEENVKITVVGKGRDNTMYKTISTAKYCPCADSCFDD